VADVDARHVAPPRLFADRERFAREDADARKRWRALPLVRQAALLLLAREQLLRMALTVEEWLPASIEPGTPAWIDVHMLFELRELDEVAAEAMVLLDARRAERDAELDEMARQLGAGRRRR
jgi:hypothetical protein